MINSKYIYLLILFSINHFTVGMESIPQSDQAVLMSKTTKKTKKNKKRKARKKASSDQKKEELKSLLKVRIEQLQEDLKPTNLKKLFQIKDILEGFNFLANMLLFQSWIIKEIKTIAFHSKNLVQTSSDNFFCCFCITDDGAGLCGKAPCDCAYPLLTAEARSLAKELVLPILYAEEIWEDYDLLDKLYHKGKSYVGNKNEELSIVGKYVVNKLSADWINDKINRIYDDVLSRIAVMVFNDDSKSADTLILINKKGISNIIATWLIESKIYAAAQKLVPDFIAIFIDVWDLIELFYDLWDDSNDLLDVTIATDFHHDVESIISTYEQLEPFYKKLYNFLHTQLKSKKSFYRQIYLDPTLKCLPKDLNNPLEYFPFLGENAEINFLRRKKTKKQLLKNKEKLIKKQYKYNNKKEEVFFEQSIVEKDPVSESDSDIDDVKENDEVLEVLSLPSYDKRIYDWFNPECIDAMLPSPSLSSILYHTYSPLADIFIKKYGIKRIQSNYSSPWKDDEAYYIPGLITYNDGSSKLVFFGICFGIDSEGTITCYHRGYTRYDDYNILSKFEKNIEKYSNDNESEVSNKKINLNDQGIYQDVDFDESPNFIRIYDSLNDIHIVLFKPDDIAGEKELS